MSTPSYDYMKTQKFSVAPTEPVVQQAAVTAPSGGTTVDTEARNALTAIIAVLKAFGLTA